MDQLSFDKLKQTAEGFLSLLDTQYHIIIGRLTPKKEVLQTSSNRIVCDDKAK